MPVEYLALWGVAQVAGFVFKPILEDLATKAAAGYAEDYLKGCLKNVLTPSEKDGLAKVVVISMKDFLQIVQEELEGSGLDESEIGLLVNPVQQLLEHRSVKETLRSPLVWLDTPASPETLANSWNDINLPNLPSDFSWSRVAKRYGKKANQIRRESNELRDVLDSQSLELIAQTLKSSAPVSPDDDLRRLQRAISKAYGYLKLESMDATTFDLNRIRLDRLFIAQHVREFTEFVQQVFEMPKDFQRRVRLLGEIRGQAAEQQELSRFRRAYLRQSPRSVVELFQDRGSRLLVILGDPGSGKSSLLQFISLQWAEYAGHDLETLEVPLLIELREYARNRQDGLAKDFLEYLHSGAGVVCRFDQHSIVERLKTGKAALLFDGLDEVFDLEQQREICADIARFSNDYPHARMFVTSRIIGYKAQTLRDAGFRHFMLQDLDSDQINDFLNRWHSLAYPVRTEGEEKKRLLVMAIAESKAIRELAGNPLLLTMMAILNRTQDLPRDRAELHTQCSRLLLYQWKADDALRADARFKGITIDFKDKQSMLRRVARAMQGSELGLAGNLIPQSTLEQILEDVLLGLGLQQAKLLSRAVIEQLPTRNFVLCYVGGEHYAFVHRTFLEYFCAFDFLWQFEKERSIDVNQLKTGVFQAHFADETWHETLCLICGMLVPKLAADVIEHLLSLLTGDGRFSNVLLAARCFAEVRNRGEVHQTGEKLRAALLAVIDTPLPPKSLRARKIKQRLAQPSAEGEVDKLLQEARAQGEQVNKIRAARPRALAAWLMIWHDDESLAKLKEILESITSDAPLREAALRQLTANWGEQESTFQFIYSLGTDRIVPVLATGDSKSLSRLAALSHLVRTWPNRPEVAALLESLATSNEDETLQEWAVKQIGGVLESQPEKIETLHKVLERKPALAVRRECFGALAELESLAPKTLELAKAEVPENSGGKVKRRVIRILAKAPKTDIEIPSLFMVLATTGLSAKANNQAKKLLTEVWIHLPEVQAFLASHPPASAAIAPSRN